MGEYTIEEQIVTQIARSFKPEDNLVTAALTNCGFVGLALAQRLYAPQIKLCTGAKGRWALLSNISFPFMVGRPPEKFIETLATSEEVFAWVVSGKWCMIMQPVQIDKFGNANLAFIGDKRKPSRVFVGPRALPDNTTYGLRTYYIVTEHTRRLFMEKVDFICGVGYGEERKQGTIKWGAPYRVFSNLGVFDFEEKSGRMRLKSLYQGISLQQVIDNTGFELIIPQPVPVAEAPTQEELSLIREVIDPLGVRNLDSVKGEAYTQMVKGIMSGAAS